MTCKRIVGGSDSSPSSFVMSSSTDILYSVSDISVTGLGYALEWNLKPSMSGSGFGILATYLVFPRGKYCQGLLVPQSDLLSPSWQ